MCIYLLITLATIALFIFTLRGNGKCQIAIKQHEVKQLKRLLKQTSRWLLAALQDDNDLVAVLHINYAMGYWYAIQDTFDDYEIDRAIGGIKKRKMLETKLLQSQELITKRVSSNCPQFTSGLDDFLATLGGDK